MWFDDLITRAEKGSPLTTGEADNIITTLRSAFPPTTGANGNFFQVNGDSVIYTSIYSSLDVTFAELAALSAGSLIRAGVWYRITDFRSIYDQPISGTAKQGTVEPILVLGISSTLISPLAFSPTNRFDIIYYDSTYTTTPINAQSAKGRITRRIDTINNIDVYCDFRNILFWDDFNNVEDAMFNGTTKNVTLPDFSFPNDSGTYGEFSTIIFKGDATNVHSLVGDNIVFEGNVNNLSNVTVFETHFQDEVDGISNSNIALGIFEGTAYKINDTEISGCTFNGNIVNLLGSSISTTDANNINNLVNSIITNCSLLVDGAGTLSIDNVSNLFIEGITIDSEDALITSIENINGNSTNITINIPAATNANFFDSDLTKMILSNGTNFYTAYLNGGGSLVTTVIS